MLDPGRMFIKMALSREHCTYVNGILVKNLDVLGRNLMQCVIVDNTMEAFAFQVSGQ